MATAQIATNPKAELLAAAAALDEAAASLKDAAASWKSLWRQNLTRPLSKSVVAIPTDQQTSIGKTVYVKPTHAKPLVSEEQGSVVIEYRGEVISQNLPLERMEGIYKNNNNFHFLEYEKGEVIDACQKGTTARFVNHMYLDTEMSSVRFGQTLTVGQIRQRQSDKYKLGKKTVIRFTGLFLFRNIRVVESKYGRKRSLEGVFDDLRANIEEEEDAAQE
ncbi:hypothetical protein BGZ82_004831 [Podila clonocystis]|nr:hypothetical protein BGZ82_004831 [Podila clonocystis]